MHRFKKAAPEASRLYKTGRYKTYADAMKQALKKVGGGKRKVAAVKFLERGETKRSPVRKTYRRVRTKTGLFKGVQTVAGSGIGKVSAGTLKAELKKRIVQRIDRAVIRKYHATGVRIKRKIQKTINQAKSELRKLC